MDVYPDDTWHYTFINTKLKTLFLPDVFRQSSFRKLLKAAHKFKFSVFMTPLIFKFWFNLRSALFYINIL